MINCFIPYSTKDSVSQTIASLKKCSQLTSIFLLYTDVKPNFADVELIKVSDLHSTKTLRLLASYATAPYSLLYTKQTPLLLGQYALERFLQVAADTQAGIVYADYYQSLNGEITPLPTIEYQLGSLRDDFTFGSVFFLDTKVFKLTVDSMQTEYRFAGLYDFRLKVAKNHRLFHINEFLYTEIEQDSRKSSEKQFDYVDPKNRKVQMEMEQACTDYLKDIGAYLKPEFTAVQFDMNVFPVEASVIIPVRNRATTIADAIHSVLIQQTDFIFNLIVVDNFSTDGTTEIIKNLAEQDARILLLNPSRTDLGIGGCWNEGVHHVQCGKFSVQLDSDDVYAHPLVLQTIVNGFYEQQCAMLIGTYTMTNFALETIPPGIIDHREWTVENGRNNALRINGLGAPRAFYTPILRKYKVPNTSYGEDYALGLRFSRKYLIGRIYDSLYYCRRWEDNSDASLDIQKINGYNLYKDKLRSSEILARQALVLRKG